MRSRNLYLSAEPKAIAISQTQQRLASSFLWGTAMALFAYAWCLSHTF